MDIFNDITALANEIKANVMCKCKQHGYVTFHRD